MIDVSQFAKPLPSTRSAVSNGSRLHLADVDGRSLEARRFRDVLSEIMSDLGGSDRLSEGQRQLARRAAMLSVRGELMEAEAVKTGKIDLPAYGTLTDQLGRCLNRIGLRRVARDIGPQSIAEYAEMKRRQREAAP